MLIGKSENIPRENFKAYEIELTKYQVLYNIFSQTFY